MIMKNHKQEKQKDIPEEPNLYELIESLIIEKQEMRHQIKKLEKEIESFKRKLEFRSNGT